MLLFRNFKLCNHLFCAYLNQIKTQITSTTTARYHIFTKPKLTSKCNRRSVSFYDWFRKPSESEYKYKDKIAPEYKLIYTTTMDKYLVLGQVVTGTVGTILGIGAIVYGDVITAVPKENEPQKKPRVNNEFIIFATALIVCVVITQRMISKVPVRIYKSPITKQYVFVNRGVMPFSRKYFTCVANQLEKVQGGSSIVPWRDSNYKLVQGEEEKSLVLLDHCFKRPADLNILLGYQKEDGE